MDTLLDASLREIGQATDYAFGIDDGVELARGLAASGVDVIEIGYVRPAGWGGPPSWASCSPNVIARAREACGSKGLSVFAHPRTLERHHLEAIRDAGVDLVRVGISLRDEEDDLRELADQLVACGLPFSVNLMRASKRSTGDVTTGAVLATELGASMVYLADSNGSMMPARVAELIHAMRGATELELGFHGHDNLSLAFANTIAAIEGGVTRMDACIGGAGKGGGNLSTERIALYLHWSGRGRFDLVRLATVSKGWLSQHSVNPTGFWEAVNGTLDLDLPECLAAGALPLAERPDYYHVTHGLSLVSTTSVGAPGRGPHSASTSEPTAIGGEK